MRFNNFYFLFLLLLLPVFVWIILNFKTKDKILFSNIALLKNAYNKKNYRQKILLSLKIFSLFLLIIALARPQLGLVTTESSTRGVDIILCMDTSTSMRALDFNPQNRLDVAKEAAKEFVKERKNDRIGIVVFSGLSFTQCPLTTDHAAVIDFLDRVEIGMTQVDGTAIGTAIMTSINRLKNSNAKSKIIILLTDGRNNAGEIDPLTASKTAQALDIKIYTIGTGAPGQALYPIDDPFWGRRYVYLPEELDETQLKTIAGITGGEYYRAKTKKGMFEIYKEIDKLEKTEIKTQNYTEYKELYSWFVLFGFIFFILEIILSKIIFVKIP